MTSSLTDKKKIALLGFAREGKASYSYLTKIKKINPKQITILDSNQDIKLPNHVHSILWQQHLQSLSDFDLIVRTAGASPYLEELQEYKKQWGTLVSHMTLFFEEYKGKVIGITWTKGKTTTTQLTYNMLKEGGIKATLLGNMGKPALTSLDWNNPPEYVVCELSSYSLEDAQPHCHIAIIINLFHEHHAKRHHGLENYHNAKRNITNNAEHVLIGSQIKAQWKEKWWQQFGSLWMCYIADDHLQLNQKKILKTKDIKLIGSHNHYNACAAVATASLLWIADKYIQNVLKKFGWVEHRLEYVGEFNHIHRYNDAIASTPESTIAALQAYPKTQTIFLGWVEWGYSYDELIKEIGNTDIENIVCYPETGTFLFKQLAKKYNCIIAEDFEEWIAWASQETKEGAIALLSCGAAYTLGIPFEEKGRRFKTFVSQL